MFRTNIAVTLPISLADRKTRLPLTYQMESLSADSPFDMCYGQSGELH